MVGLNRNDFLERHTIWSRECRHGNHSLFGNFGGVGEPLERPRLIVEPVISGYIPSVGICAPLIPRLNSNAVGKRC